MRPDPPTPLEQALERLAAKDAVIAELRGDLDTAQRQTTATKAWGEGYQNALSRYFDKMGLNGAGSLDDRMAHVAKVCDKAKALGMIAGLMGIGSWDDPDTIRLVVKDMRTALRDLGVNPGGDLQGEVRAIHNRAAANEAAAQHDLDCALRERDRANDDARIATARIKELEGKIASTIAEAAARDMRIADLEAAIESTHKVFDGVGVTWSMGSDATRLPLAKRATLAVEPDAFGVSELRLRIADLERDLTTKDASLKTANAALSRICEVIGAPVPVCPDDAVEAVTRIHDAYARVNTTLNDLSEFMRAVAPDTLPPWTGADVVRAVESVHARAVTAEAVIAEIGLALDDYGTPTHYNAKGSPHDKGAVIPAAERVRVGLMVLWSKWCEAQGKANETEYNLDMLDTEIHHAHKTLDALDVPRQAGGADLDLAARIRALPR